MACMQQTRPSCESNYSSEHAKHDHKATAYSSQGGSQAVVCNPASANKHHNPNLSHSTHSSSHYSLTEKVAGLFGSHKNNQGSGCGSNGHQAAAYGNHGHQAAAHGSHGHQVAAHGHNGSGCNGSSHGHNHSHHKSSNQESYFEEKKEYSSCKAGGQKKVEKKVKKKSSYKCSSSDSESDKEHC